MPEKQAKKRGGHRKGAGRPKVYDEPRAVISGSIPAALVDAVNERANASGSTVSALVEAAIATWLDSVDERAERHAIETGQTVAEIRTAAIAEYLAKRGI